MNVAILSSFWLFIRYHSDNETVTPDSERADSHGIDCVKLTETQWRAGEGYANTPPRYTDLPIGLLLVAPNIKYGQLGDWSLVYAARRPHGC